MKRTVVDRSKWLRGTGMGLLLDEDTQKMCCLGFEGMQQYGLSPATLSRQGYLTEVVALHEQKICERWERQPPSELTERVCDVSTALNPCRTLEDAAVTVNDARGLSASEREDLLREIFALADREIVFVDREE